jgi:hypothetical protein
VFIGDRPRDVDDGITNPFKKSTDETSVTFIDETVFVSENSKFLFVQVCGSQCPSEHEHCISLFFDRFKPGMNFSGEI